MRVKPDYFEQESGAVVRSSILPMEPLDGAALERPSNLVALSFAVTANRTAYVEIMDGNESSINISDATSHLEGVAAAIVVVAGWFSASVERNASAANATGDNVVKPQIDLKGLTALLRACQNVCATCGGVKSA